MTSSDPLPPVKVTATGHLTRTGLGRLGKIVPGTPQPKMIRVLVVEDEPAVTEAFSLSLKALGYASYCCTHPGEAIHHLMGGSYDVVLSDFMMPFMTGLELAVEAKKAGCRIPFIIVTGSMTQFAPETLKANNIRFVLRKPVSLDEVDYALKRSMSLNATP